MDNEIWKQVKGYEGIYEISSIGRLKRLSKTYTDKNGVTYSKKESITIGQKTKQGYLRTGLTKNGVRTKYLVHRLVAESFIPNPENKKQVNHKNGIKDDNRLDNLEWCTNSENIKHAYDKLGFNPKKLLTDDQVRYIRLNYKKGNGAELAKIFNINPSTISHIVTGKTYKNIR